MIRKVCGCGYFLENEYDDVCDGCLDELIDEFAERYISAYPDQYAIYDKSIHGFCMMDVHHFIDFVSKKRTIDMASDYEPDVLKAILEHESMIRELNSDYLDSVLANR